MVKYLRSASGFNLPVGSQDGDLLFVQNNALQRRAIGTNGQFLGINSGLPNWANQLDTILSIPSQSTGDLYYKSSGGYANLGVGSTGQVLTVAGGLPSWASPATASGDMQGTPVIITSTGQTLTRNRYSIVTATNATAVMPSVATTGWFVVVNATATPIAFSASGTTLNSRVVPPYSTAFIYTNTGLTDYISNTTPGSIITTFAYTGSDQFLTVPSGYNNLEYYLIGAAGGRSGIGGTFYPGSAGGGTTGILAVSSGSIKIIVGQGGRSSTSAQSGNYGGGGGTVASPNLAGEGGGRSAIQLVSGTDSAVAGGGGGRGRSDGIRGAGGGTIGGSGGNATGGTQSAGGAGVATGANGSLGQGGLAGIDGGGGGGGFYGGGGSENYSASYGSGAGGSGLAGGTSATTTAGSGSTPALTGDSRYPGGTVGYGNNTTNQAGHGYVYTRLY